MLVPSSAQPTACTDVPAPRKSTCHPCCAVLFIAGVTGGPHPLHPFETINAMALSFMLGHFESSDVLGEVCGLLYDLVSP